MTRALWITGAPGSGKTTSARALQGVRSDVRVLDAEDIRAELYPDLGYSDDERWRNIRTLTALARENLDAGRDVIVAAVSPLARMRAQAVQALGEHRCAVIGLEPREDRMWPESIYEPVDAPISSHVILDDVEAFAEIYFPRPSRQLFIGRWQPFHAGHQTIIREALAQGPVAVGIRRTRVDANNPYSVSARAEMIRSVFVDEDVEVFACPDIDSIHVGRDVGYDIVRHDGVPGISGRDLRRNKGLDS